MPGRTKSNRDSALTKVRGLKIRLRKREILRTLRHTSGSKVINESIENIIQEEIQNAYSLIYPSVIYRTIFKEKNNYKEINGILGEKSEKIKNKLSSSLAVTLMAGSAGSAIDEEINSLKEKNLTRALILDAAGSEAAEQAVNFVSRIISARARDIDCYTGMRFSPGYGDWPLENSAKIIEFLKAGKIGIKLSDSGIMIPRKSVTAAQLWFAL